jgi:hypothetical protein
MDVFSGMEGCTGVSSGFSVSEVPGKGRVFVGVAGWSSLEASDAAKSKFAVADGKLDTCRVNFRFPVKGFRGL